MTLDIKKIRVERRTYSYTIGIPMWVARKLNLMTGDELAVELKDNKIIYSKIADV